MSESTKIEWCDHTFNPWIGCTQISPACDNCYAKAFDRRFAVSGHAMHWGAGVARKRTGEANWRLPLKWDLTARIKGIRPKVFCASLADVFDNEVSPEWRTDLFRLIGKTQNIDWLLLTKRIGNAGDMVQDSVNQVTIANKPNKTPPWPWSNVWIGATICNQEEADRDIPKLLAVPAHKRFLSMEPLLGPVNLAHLNDGKEVNEVNCLEPDTWADEIEAWRDTEDGWEESFEDHYGSAPETLTGLMHAGIDWVIVGGESGRSVRPMHPNWARSLRDQCAIADIPFFFKQWGEWKPICQMDDAEHGGLYAPKVIAKPHEDQDILNDIYGRRCIPATSVIHLDGSIHKITDPMAFSIGAMQTFKIGKKSAGRLLDGREWNGVPA